MLTAQERDKFAAYLEREAASDRMMLEQLGKLSGQEMMIKKLNAEAMASEIVAKRLRSIDTETLD